LGWAFPWPKYPLFRPPPLPLRDVLRPTLTFAKMVQCDIPSFFSLSWGASTYPDFLSFGLSSSDASRQSFPNLLLLKRKIGWTLLSFFPFQVMYFFYPPSFMTSSLWQAQWHRSPSPPSDFVSLKGRRRRTPPPPFLAIRSPPNFLLLTPPLLFDKRKYPSPPYYRICRLSFISFFYHSFSPASFSGKGLFLKSIHRPPIIPVPPFRRNPPFFLPVEVTSFSLCHLRPALYLVFPCN